MPDVSHHHATRWNPHHQPVDASDIVILVTDALFEYLPPDSGITPTEVLIRVRSVIDSTAGMAAYVSDAMRPGVGADVIVAKLAEVLDQGDPDPKETVSQLLEVVESPLAMEVYDREMERRHPRDADSWH